MPRKRGHRMYLLFYRVPVTLKEVQKAQTVGIRPNFWGVHSISIPPSTLQPFASATPPHRHGLPFPPPSPPGPAVPGPGPLAPGPGPGAALGAAGAAGGEADPRGRAQQGTGGHRGGQPAAGPGAGADFGAGLGNGAVELLGCEVCEMFEIALLIYRCSRK